MVSKSLQRAPGRSLSALTFNSFLICFSAMAKMQLMLFLHCGSFSYLDLQYFPIRSSENFWNIVPNMIKCQNIWALGSAFQMLGPGPFIRNICIISSFQQNTQLQLNRASYVQLGASNRQKKDMMSDTRFCVDEI